MGGSLSCGDCHRENCFNTTSLFSGPTSYRFAAEMYKLSENRSEWIKMNPNILQITVSRFNSNDQPDTVAELSATNLKHQQILRLPFSKESKIEKYSDRFVYWKNKDETIYALNIVCKTDVDHLFAIASFNDVEKISAQKFKCEIAALMHARHGHIIEQENLRLSDCTVVFKSPNSLEFFDCDEKLLFSTSAFEILLSVNETRRLIFLSFPSKAVALYFRHPNEIRSFVQSILNESSIALADGIRSTEHVISWLNRTLDSVVAMIRMPNSTTISVDLCADPRIPGNAAAASKHYIETLYSLKYMLIFRIAILKGVIPNSTFSEMVFPTELRAKVVSGHLANYIHLYCCLHTQFSMKKQLKDINDSGQFLKNLESNSRKISEQKVSTKNDETENYRLNDEKLVKSVVELVHTEEKFVNDLNHLMTRYVKPANLNFLNCVDKLQKTHTIFLNSLQDAGGDLLSLTAQSLDYTQIKDAVMRISALFINKCNKFKIYSEYSAAYLRFQHLYRIDQDFKSKLDQLNASGQHRESVESLLIKPIQRVLKYPLFLEQIRDFCFKDSMEQRQCLQALGRMQTLATYVNEMQRIHEEYGFELEKLAKLPDLAKKNLWMDLRDLLMFSHLKWLQSGDRRYSECVAFVFTSLVLILGPESTSKKKQPRSYKIFPIREIQVNETIPENLTNLSDPNNSEHFFSINHSISDSSEIIYYISCCHADIKTHFIKSVKRALKVYLKQKPRPVSGSSQSDWGYASAH